MSTDKNEEIEKRINDTINSLEGLGKAKANPFFYTRLEARMQEELLPANSPFAFLGNLKLSVAVLTLFMVLNVVSIFLISGSSNDTTMQEEATLETFSEEFFSGADQYDYSNDY